MNGIIEPEKIESISIGDIVTIKGAPFIICNDAYGFGYTFISTKISDSGVQNPFDLSAINISGNLKSNHIILKTHVDIVDNINKMNTMVELSNYEIKNIVKVVRYFYYTDSQLCLYYYPFLGKVYHTKSINLVDVHSLPKKSNELLKYSSLLTKDEEAFLKLNINIDRVTPYV